MKKSWLLLSGLALLTAFGAIFFNAFVYDDVPVIAQNAYLHASSPLIFWKGSVIDSGGGFAGSYRPLFMTFLWGLVQIGGAAPAWLRAWSLLLHCVNATLLFGIARKLFQREPTEAWVAAMIFALHPLQVGTLSLVWKQSDIWIACFSLASIYGAFRYQNSAWKVPALYSVLLMAGLLTKENGMILPLFWILVEPFLAPPFRKRRLAVIAIGIAGVVFYYQIRYFWAHHAPWITANPASRWDYFATQVHLFPVYLRDLLWPLNLAIDRPIVDFRFSWGEASVLVLLTGAIVGLSMQIVRFRTTWPVVPLVAVIWLLPTSSFQTLNLYFDGTRLYLVVGALSLAMIGWSGDFWRRRRILVGALLSTLVALSFTESLKWKDSATLWGAVAAQHPCSEKANGHLAEIAEEARDLDEAERLYRQILHCNPNVAMAWLRLGIIVGQKGHLEEAEKYFRHLTTAQDRRWAALGHYYLGRNEAYLGRWTEAQKEFDETRRLMPKGVPIPRMPLPDPPHISPRVQKE